MENTQEIFEKIESYLAGNLVGDELEVFENSLKTNPELQEEVKRHRELAQALKNKKVLDFRRKLVKIEEKIYKDKDHTPKVKRLVPNYWKIAASIAVVIGLSVFLWTMNQQEDLYASYYVPYPIENAKRGNENFMGKEFKVVAEKYKNRDYNKAIPNLEILVKAHPNNEQLKLYLGNCYLNVGQIDEAIGQFLSINPKNRYYEDGLWYTALSYLKLKQNSEVQQVLKKLVAHNGVHKQNAITLLKDIE